MPNVPLYRVTNDIDAYRRVQSPGGYESWHFVAEDVEHRAPFDDASAERVLGLETNDEDGVARVRGAVLQMMENAAYLRHAGRRNDQMDFNIVDLSQYLERPHAIDGAGSPRYRNDQPLHEEPL